jgi:hypothetical protein
MHLDSDTQGIIDEKMAKRFRESEPEHERTTTSIIERWKKMLESYTTGSGKYWNDHEITRNHDN